MQQLIRALYAMMMLFFLYIRAAVAAEADLYCFDGHNFIPCSTIVPLPIMPAPGSQVALGAALPPGGNLLGRVNVAALPPLPAGQNVIGAVFLTDLFQQNYAAIDPTGRLTIQGSLTPLATAWINRSGSITTGGTSQTLVGINPTRRRLLIENPCSATSQGIAAAENLFINFTSAASTSAGTSVELQACGSYDSGAGPVTTELITVNAATTSHQYMAKEM